MQSRQEWWKELVWSVDGSKSKRETGFEPVTLRAAIESSTTELPARRNQTQQHPQPPRLDSTPHTTTKHTHHILLRPTSYTTTAPATMTANTPHQCLRHHTANSLY